MTRAPGATRERWSNPNVRGFGWGLIDQGFSSATSFGLSLLAGRLLGPSGLGSVFIGFSAYLVAFGFQRSLLTEPLVAISAALPPESRRRIARLGLTVSIACGLVAAAMLAVAGAVISGTVGNSLLLFAPWMVPALVQDYWRSVLFLERRGRAAATNDGLWLAVMVATAPVVWLLDSQWAVIAWWGAGAAAGAALGFGQLRIRPGRFRAARAWWQEEAWPVGRWLAASTGVYSMTAYVTTFALAGLLGTGDVGGLQAVTVIFGPLSLLGAAFALPALPAISRALAVSLQRARTLALQVSFTTTALVAAYVAVVHFGGTGLLESVFGESFSGFAILILPVGLAQILSAPAGGFELLMLAQKRGRAYLVSGAVGQVTTVFLALGLAVTHGVRGAAWGLAVGSAIRTSSRIWFALRRRRAKVADATDEADVTVVTPGSRIT